MLLDDYFKQINILIDRSGIIQESALVCESRSYDRGFIRGDLLWTDGSVFSIREFVKTTPTIYREMYAYQYMTADNQLIFDMTIQVIIGN